MAGRPIARRSRRPCQPVGRYRRESPKVQRDPAAVGEVVVVCSGAIGLDVVARSGGAAAVKCSCLRVPEPVPSTTAINCETAVQRPYRRPSRYETS